MIHVSGWLTEERPINGLEDDRRFVLPVSCGYHRTGPQDEDDYFLSRPHGRLDYQIIYIQNGRAQFDIGGKKREITSGQVVVIPPKVPHSYRLIREREAIDYWLHCTGYGMQMWVSKLNQHDFPCIVIGQSRKTTDLYRSIMMELQRKEPEYVGVASGLVTQLLYYILRKQIRLEDEADQQRDIRIDQCVTLMHEQYAQDWTVDRLAAIVHLSPSRFIHLFTQIHHMSPCRFLNRVRISKAKEFLDNDHLTVSEVSRMVGFPNPQYFSRLFHQEVGMSPSAYRQQTP